LSNVSIFSIRPKADIIIIEILNYASLCIGNSSGYLISFILIYAVNLPITFIKKVIARG